MYLPSEAERSIELVFFPTGHLATRQSVDSAVQIKQLNFLVTKWKLIQFYFYFFNYTGNLFSAKLCKAPPRHSGCFLRWGKLLRYPSKLCFWQAPWCFSSALIDLQWLCFVQGYLPNSWSHNAALRSNLTTCVRQNPGTVGCSFRKNVLHGVFATDQAYPSLTAGSAG